MVKNRVQRACISSKATKTSNPLARKMGLSLLHMALLMILQAASRGLSPFCMFPSADLHRREFLFICIWAVGFCSSNLILCMHSNEGFIFHAQEQMKRIIIFL
ncbi:hypothetical protein SUGI_0460550 [Cryptomeria japonica]|nr:hypothetical protein SUGI_0460550 [Cryptomeria japonica]